MFYVYPMPFISWYETQNKGELELEKADAGLGGKVCLGFVRMILIHK